MYNHYKDLKLIKTPLVALVFCIVFQASSISEAAVAKYETDPNNSGYKCIYEGVSYNVGEELPTEGKCWHCVCHEGFTEPDLLSCAQIECPPHNGFHCEVTHEEGKCCPIYSNCTELVPRPPDTRVVTTPDVRLDRCHHCDQRYFKHYEAKQCKPVYDEGCDCPKGFDCPDLPADEDQTVCTYKGKTFAEGEAMPTSNPCEICSCRKNYFSNDLGMDCIGVECGSTFSSRFDREACYEVFEEGQCCPATVKCDSDASTNTTEVELNCEFEGKTYHQGQKMYSEEDPCLICLCDERFHGKDSDSCHIHECNLERKMQDIRSGCIPIYHEKTCCPIEFHCADGLEGRHPAGPNEYVAANESDPHSYCTFNEKSYSIGDQLEVNHPTHCVTCTCMTPPDFTCIHKSCQPPPNNDYERCQSIYVPGECCPKYQCTLLSAPQKICDPVRCEGECVEVNLPNGCPMCQCQNILCAPPKCLPNCEIEYDVPPGSCPTCKCTGISAQIRPVCDPVKCSPECFEGISAQGCPMCVCGPLCSPPKCDEGCHLQTNVVEGQCPGCECHDISNNSFDFKVLCSPVKCPPMCQEVVGNAGCPTCKCDVMCSPPQCMPGCHMETPPYSEPCPGCVCEDKDKISVIQCAPVHCSDGCSEVSVPNGCPMCHCANILCSPPKCEEGCTVETEVPPGGCPGCKCPPTMQIDRPMCGVVKCGPQCYEGVSPQGCPMCVCGPLCSPPKCEEGCHIKSDVEEGQCPYCVCDNGAGNTDLSQIQCSPVLCPSYCRKGIGHSGCETCFCEPLCSPPKCEVGCRVETIPSSGPCPGCICDSTLDPFVQCSPVKCEPGCSKRIDLAKGPCPFCYCEADEDQTDPDLYTRVRCSPPKCEPGCYPKLTPPGPCPTCFCQDQQDPFGTQCSIPKCDPGCEIKLIPPGPCPSCSCEEKRLRSPIQCSPPKCDPGCFPKLTPPNPCPACSCGDMDGPQDFGIQCSPPKCDPGCFPKLTPPNPCPACSCGDMDGPADFDIQCSPPKCDPGCFPKLTPPNPCPACSCGDMDGPTDFGIQCSPPKCDPGCFPKLTPPNPCPACSCGDMDSPRDFGIQCSPPKCDPGCFPKLTPPNPCPACSCGDMDGSRDFGIQCSPPKCGPGCFPKLTPPNPCPACSCGDMDGPRDFGIQCSPPKCNPGCFPKLTPPNPCPACSCGDTDGPLPPITQCAPVKCDPGCYVEANDALGGCPTCICDGRNFRSLDTIQCSHPRCDFGCYPKVIPPGRCAQCFCRDGGRVGGMECPQLSCQLPCRKVKLSPWNCPVCICDKAPICTIPDCEPGCTVDVDSTGDCLECVCPDKKSERIRSVQCAPVNCGPMCRETRNQYGCPSCQCGVMCSPPRCRPGCPATVTRGPCPSCSC